MATKADNEQEERALHPVTVIVFGFAILWLLGTILFWAIVIAISI